MSRPSTRSISVRTGSSRVLLRGVYYVWIAFPYPLRRLVTAAYIAVVLLMKKITRVDQQNDLTPSEKLGTLSFWGVPEVDLQAYRLMVTGEVESPLKVQLEEILALPSVTREVRMDCVGGFRNNSIMTGVPLRTVLERAGLKSGARTAVFYCADGYFTSLTLPDLFEREALLVYQINHEEVPRFGYPLRLAVPGKYGYKWAKWVTHIRLARGDVKGHWERKGLPHRANVGDVF